LAKQSKNTLIVLHQNAQRLIKPMLVANPFAQELTFINDKTRTRRDHMKYLTLINSITLLHQHQRTIKTIKHQGETVQYIDVTKQDIAMANKLAHEILGRSLDELPPQTRTLLKLVHKMVKKRIAEEAMEQSDYRFTRREIREYCGWTDFQIKKHITRLQDMEYLLVHRGGRGQSFVYELLYNNEGQDGQNFVLGLKEIDGSNMENHVYDKNKEPQITNKEPSSSPQVVPKEPRSSTKKNSSKPNNTNGSGNISQEMLENAHLGLEKNSNHNNRTHALNTLN